MRARSRINHWRLAVGLLALGFVPLASRIVVPDLGAAPPEAMISITDAAATETSCTGASAVFSVQLSRNSKQIVSVQFATADGTASAGSDYIAQSGVLTFQPKERSKSIVVSIVGDQVTEGAETFVVNLSNPVNASVSDGQGMGTVFNDLCDDQNICTHDSCSAAAGCQHQAIDLGQTTCGTGACRRTVQTCVNGVPQTCTPGTPTAELCNGIDDNCDGTVDGPGSESSCQLPNATHQCSGGVCVIGACLTGFGDCNGDPTDGCENDLTALPDCGGCGNICDDASLCTNDICVARTCQHVDRKRCANLDPADVNPTDPTQCGPNGCGVCNFATPFDGCPDPDSDGDGLSDTWEDAQMIDFNCDGVYDSNDVAIPGADKHIADVYVKASAMANSPTETFESLHIPSEEAIRRVVAMFGGSHLTTPPVRCDATSPACPADFTCSTEDFVCLSTCATDADCATGVCLGGRCSLRRLHFDHSAISIIPHANVIFFGPVQAACLTGGDTTQGVNFYDIKANPSNFNPKEGLFTHYGVFGHFQSCDSSNTCSDSACLGAGGGTPDFANSGLAEMPGNDWVVTLGASSTPTIDVKVTRDSGAFMHELGHNLRLHHGGPDCDPQTDPTCTYVPDQDRKVNYMSVMNHLYNFGIPLTDTPGSIIPSPNPPRPDFSHSVLGTSLNETDLDEAQGVNPGNPPAYSTDLVQYFCPSPSPGVPPLLSYGSTLAGQPIDWNCNGVIESLVQVNVNNVPPGPFPNEIHRGAEDWTHLVYRFQCSTTFVDGAKPSNASSATRKSIVP